MKMKVKTPWLTYGRETYNCDLKAEQLALTTWKSPKVTLLEQCTVVVNTIAAMLLLSQWKVQWEYLEVPQILPCNNTCKLKWNTAEVTRPAKTLWPEGIPHWQPNEVLGSEQTWGWFRPLCRIKLVALGMPVKGDLTVAGKVPKLLISALCRSLIRSFHQSFSCGVYPIKAWKPWLCDSIQHFCGKKWSMFSTHHQRLKGNCGCRV